MSKLLVVDSDVLQASGISEKDRSKQCREVLEKIMEICHRVIVTKKIRKEWEEHFSSYSYKWYDSMVSRGKIVSVKIGTELPELEKKLDTIKIEKGIRNIIQKDLFLIEAANSADGIIVTCDDRFKLHFTKLQQALDFNKEIVWINPMRQNISELSERS